jgi:hypothetical protein
MSESQRTFDELNVTLSAGNESLSVSPYDHSSYSWPHDCKASSSLPDDKEMQKLLKMLKYKAEMSETSRVEARVMVIASDEQGLPPPMRFQRKTKITAQQQRI